MCYDIFIFSKYFISKMQNVLKFASEIVCIWCIDKRMYTKLWTFCSEFRYRTSIVCHSNILPLVFQRPFVKEVSYDGCLKQNTNIVHSLSQVFFLISSVVLFYSFIVVTLQEAITFPGQLLGTGGGMRSFSGILMAMEGQGIGVIIIVLLRPDTFKKYIYFKRNKWDGN